MYVTEGMRLQFAVEPEKSTAIDKSRLLSKTIENNPDRLLHRHDARVLQSERLRLQRVRAGLDRLREDRKSVV